MGIPVILDCDSSFDSRGDEVGGGLAVMCLLGARPVEPVGITTSFGAQPVDVAYRQARGLLRVLRREEIPLLHGAPWPSYRSTEAAHFLARAVHERPGQITVVATGPLANLRAASEVSPTFFSEVGRIVCAGGRLGAARLGWGALRERCFTSDPEAARLVLGARRPVVVLPAELGLQSLFTRGDLAPVRAWPEWVRRPVRGALLRSFLRTGCMRLPLWDVLPVAYALRPESFEDRTCGCLSGPKELARGELRIAARGRGAATNVPARLRDPELLRRWVIETAASCLSPSTR